MGPRRSTPFRFENFWIGLPRFQEVVQNTWNTPTQHTEPFHRLGHKLFMTSRALRRWSSSLISDARMKLLMAQQVILRLDEAMDMRDLSPAEEWLRSRLKKRIMGWAIIEKARRKQCSRVLYLKEGDANTRFFHLKANGRRRKNFIHKLENNDAWAFTHRDKQQIINQHFESIMKEPTARTTDFNWSLLQTPTLDLSTLDRPFTEEEVLQAINSPPMDKAPGPDGFTGLFFKHCWGITRAQKVNC